MFTIYVEHKKADNEMVLEEFSGVVKFDSPPMVDLIQITFGDDRDDKQLRYGNVVKATQDD